MDVNDVIITRLKKLKELKSMLNKTEDKLTVLAEELNWDYKKLLEDTSIMVTCSINPQHRMPISSLKAHKQNCSWHYEGYSKSEKTFPEHSGTGSCIILTSESIHSITKNISSEYVNMICYSVSLPGVNYYYDGIQNKSYPFTDLCKYYLVRLQFSSESKSLRAVPQSSANLDQNFEREEKLAIYDYVIANTLKQESYPDLWLEPSEKSEEKREMAAWEIAAAERDAKRRRASYRNKVHTNRKTHTEILREVIEAQMEAFKGDVQNEKAEECARFQTVSKTSSHESKESSNNRRRHESSSHHGREDRNKSRNHDSHSKHREYKRYPSDTGSDTKSRSRFYDKHRKWKTYEGRSHSHRSSHTHRR